MPPGRGRRRRQQLPRPCPTWSVRGAVLQQQRAAADTCPSVIKRTDSEPRGAAGPGSRTVRRRRGRRRPGRRRRGAVRAHPAGRASGDPAHPGPRGPGLCVRPSFSADMSRVEDHTGDVGQARIVQLPQNRFMQPAPHTDPRPDHEPAMGGRFRDPETRRQRAPCAATHQHIGDRGEQRLVRCVLFSAALRPCPVLRNQRPGDLPQAIRNNPTPRAPPHTRPNDQLPYRTRPHEGDSPRSYATESYTRLLQPHTQHRSFLLRRLSGWL